MMMNYISRFERLEKPEKSITDRLKECCKSNDSIEMPGNIRMAAMYHRTGTLKISAFFSRFTTPLLPSPRYVKIRLAKKGPNTPRM